MVEPALETKPEAAASVTEETKPEAAASATEMKPDATPAPPKLTPEEKAREVLESHSVRVFRPSTTRFDPRQIEFPDDFFEPTAADVRAAASSITKDVRRLTNPPMMTKRMRDAEAAKRMSRFRKVMIRILFPDRIAIQGIFTPQSTTRNVQRFIRASLLDARNVKFHMFVVPPKMKLTELDATLWSQGLVPAALVHVGIDEGPTDTNLLLKKWLLEQVEDTPESVAPVPPQMPSILPEEKPSATSPAKKVGGKRKIPKWFKSK